MRLRFLRLGLVLILLLFVGCSSDKTDSGQKSSSPMAATDTAPKAATVQVSIQPADPTAADDLHLNIQGAASGEQITWLLNGRPVEDARGRMLPQGTALRGDRVEAQVVIDGATYTAQVQLADAPPRVLLVPLDKVVLAAGTDLTIEPKTLDPDGDEVTVSYRWLVNDEPVDEIEDATLPGDRFRRGDEIKAELTPYDGEKDGPVFSMPTLVVPNAPPKISSKPPASTEGNLYRYAVVAKDPDGDELHFSLDKAPEGMSIDPQTGLVEWPVAPEASGEHQVVIRVEDPDGAYATQTYQLNLKFPQ